MTKKLSIEDLAKEIRIIDFNIRTFNKPEDSKERDIYLTNRYCMDLAQGLVRYLTTLPLFYLQEMEAKFNQLKVEDWTKSTVTKCNNYNDAVEDCKKLLFTEILNNKECKNDHSSKPQTFTEMEHNKECPSLQNHPVCTCEKLRRYS